MSLKGRPVCRQANVDSFANLGAEHMSDQGLGSRNGFSAQSHANHVASGTVTCGYGCLMLTACCIMQVASCALRVAWTSVLQCIALSDPVQRLQQILQPAFLVGRHDRSNPEGRQVHVFERCRNIICVVCHARSLMGSAVLIQSSG